LGFWQELKQAFGEGYDKERVGAPIELHLDAMMLAARADRDVTDHELQRITALLRRHLHVFSVEPEESVTRSLRASAHRLDELGDEQAQFEHTVTALAKAGEVACDEAYALAYAVLLSDDGLNQAERAFAKRMQLALKVSEGTARKVERELEAAMRPST